MRPYHRKRIAAGASIAAILAVLAALNAAILLHPEQLRRRLVAFTARFVRGEVRFEGVEWSLGGHGRIARAVIRPEPDPATAARAPGVRFSELEIDGLELEHAPLELLRGRYRLERIGMGSVLLRLADPVTFLDTFRRLLELDPYLDAPPAEVAIERLALVSEAGPLPLAPLGRSEPVVFERVRLLPLREISAGATSGARSLPVDANGGRACDGLAQRRYFSIEALYRPAPFEEFAVSGHLDMLEARLELELSASNVDIRGRSLAGLAPKVRNLLAELGPCGPFDLQLRAVLPWRELHRSEVSGTLECYSLSLNPRDFPLPFTNVSGRLRFERGRLEVESLRALYGTAELKARGEIGDLRAGTGIRLELVAENVELSELRRLPLPSPYGEALRSIGAEGRGDLRLALATGAGEPLECCRIDGGLDLRNASLASGGLTMVSGDVSLDGTVPPVSATARAIMPGEPIRPPPPEAIAKAAASGTLRLDRANASGVPLRGVVARLSLFSDAILLEDAEGRAVDGPFEATIVFGLGAETSESAAAEAPSSPCAVRPPFSLSVSARGVDLAPVLTALYGRPLAIQGRASGKVTVGRRSAGGPVEARASVQLGPLDPFELPGLGPVAASLTARGIVPSRSETGTLDLSVREDGSATASLRLRSEDLALDLTAENGANGALSGELVAASPGRPPAEALRFAVAGTYLEPDFRPILRQPAAPTGTASPASQGSPRAQ